MINILKWFQPIGNIQKIFLMISCVSMVVVIFLHNPTDGYFAQYFDYREENKWAIDDQTGKFFKYKAIIGLRAENINLENVFDYLDCDIFSKGALIPWLANFKNFVFTLFCLFLVYLISKLIKLDNKTNN